MYRFLNRLPRPLSPHPRLDQFRTFPTMPKAKQGKRNSASQPAPYAANSVFKMNKDIGQHVLKNPGIAQVSLDHALY